MQIIKVMSCFLGILFVFYSYDVKLKKIKTYFNETSIFFLLSVSDKYVFNPLDDKSA